MPSSLSFTLIQSPLYWEDKAANLAMFEKKIMDIQERTEVVVLPEMFSTGFSMQPQKLAERMDGETVNWMKEIAAAKKIILTGSVIITEGDHFFNRLLWVLPDGTLGYYDKRHRFAFAGEDREYTAGHKRLIAQVKGWKINLQVCYDLRFPVWTRQQSEAEYDVLIYVANWPERRALAWRTLLQARAIENQSYVVGVNRIGTDPSGINCAGDSSVVDPLGNILYQKEHNEDIAIVHLNYEEMVKVRRQLPFLRDADEIIIQ